MSLADRILFEDNHLIIVNKLAGEIVQGDKTGDVPLVEEVRQYLKERYNKPGNVFCGLVHRIDRPVSGAVIFAKTSKALARMNELVKERHISKIYWALVEKAPEVPEQKLVDYVKKDERTNKTAVELATMSQTMQSILETLRELKDSVARQNKRLDAFRSRDLSTDMRALFAPLLASS